MAAMGDSTQASRLLSECFAQHALDTTWEDLPTDAVEQAKIFIGDTFAVGVAGSSAHGAEILTKTFGRLGQDGEASVWGTGLRVAAETAALINAYQVHCQEHDCVHEGAVLHPMATLLPATVAFAERNGGVTGRDLIVACAVGVNISAGLGITSRSGLTFFRPATAGGFGAVAAVGRLMRLSKEQMMHAFGLQYAQTSGTLQPHIEGSATLPLQVGFNSRAALHACDLAKAGFTGPRDVFEGQYGYLRLFEGPTPWNLAATLEVLERRRWLISELSHKPYPAGRATHGGIEGIQTLLQEGSDRIPASMVESVKITASPVSVRLCARSDVPNPSPSYARLCMAFVGAKVLKHGFIDLTHYRGEELLDSETHELAKRITMISDGQLDPNALTPVAVEIQLVGGEVRTWSSEQLLASPARRLSRVRHLEKFRRCWDFAACPLHATRRDALVELCDRLEEVRNVRRLSACLSASATEPRVRRQVTSARL